MSAPRLEVDLDRIEANAASLVAQLEPLGITVTGVTKATVGSPAVAAAMRRGGVAGLGDSRVENLAGLRHAGVEGALTLIRSPMASQVAAVVGVADRSCNTEPVVLDRLSAAAVAQRTTHGVVLMVELGDLREGIAAADVVDAARHVLGQPGLALAGLGTNLACQSGVVPDQAKMDELSHLVERVETALGVELPVVSGGNSANLTWALSTVDAGRVNDLRLGEAILLGCEPLDRRPLAGLRTDAFRLVAEVIEVKTKPARPWGTIGQAAFGTAPLRTGRRPIRQALLALGRQDVDPDGVVPPAGTTVLGASSDHLVLDLGDVEAAVGDELAFGVDYSALVRAMTSPFVTTVHHAAGLVVVPA